MFARGFEVYLQHLIHIISSTVLKLFFQYSLSPNLLKFHILGSSIIITEFLLHRVNEKFNEELQKLMLTFRLYSFFSLN